MANTQTIVRNLTFVITVLAAVFAGLATGGNYWMHHETVKLVPWIEAGRSTHSGLWKVCKLRLCYEIGNGSGRYNIYILIRHISENMRQFSLKTLGFRNIITELRKGGTRNVIRIL